MVLSTAWDLVTFAELKTHQNQLQNDPDFAPDFNQLIDMRDVATLEVTTEEAKILAQGSVVFSHSSRRAWLATNPSIFGLGRVIEAHYHFGSGDKAQTCVFYDRDEALKWLGLQTPSA